MNLLIFAFIALRLVTYLIFAADTCANALQELV